MKVITLANQKGGCGKTTISVNLALSLAQQKHRVILLDTDPQRNSFETIKVRDTRPIRVIATHKKIYQYLEKFENQYDYTIIDTPPHNQEIVSTSILCSDMVIIPVQYSPLDIRSTRTTVDLILKAKELNPQLKEFFLLYRIQPLSVATQELTEVLKQRYAFPILKSHVSNRAAYKQSLIYGKGIFEFSRSDPAVNEIVSLVSEIKSHLHDGESSRNLGEVVIKSRQLQNSE